MNKEKELKTAGYQETKDQDKIKQIICSYFQNMRQKRRDPCRCCTFFQKRISFNRLEKWKFNYKNKKKQGRKTTFI